MLCTNLIDYHNYNKAQGELEIQESETVPFAFTLRKTKQPVSKADYEAKLGKINALGCNVTDHVYESEAGLHCHGVIQIPKDFNKIKLRTRGWRMYLEELYDYAGWLSYMTKQNILETNTPDVWWYKSSDSPRDPDFKMPKKRLFSSD